MLLMRLFHFAQVAIPLFLFLGLSCVHAGSAPLFQAFPNVDSRQHLVYDAEVVQIVGTVNGAALLAALGASGDRRWWPLTISGARSLMSIGVGDFLDTSAGAYRELAIAFPACEAATVGSSLPPLNCASFAACQSELPDCTHTYMFVSYVTHVGMLKHIRDGGVDALRAESFDLLRDTDHVVKFHVRGPDGVTVFSGAVQTSAPEASLFGNPISAPAPAGAGHSLQPFVGRPGVAGPGQARHMCVFEKGVTVNAARIAGPYEFGELLQSLDFSIESAFHLPALRLVRLPPWGVETVGGPAVAGNVMTTSTASSISDAKDSRGASFAGDAAPDEKSTRESPVTTKSWHSVIPSDTGNLNIATTAATLQRLSPGRSWGIGDSMTVKGRRGVVSWDGRPKHKFVKLRWDNGEQSDMIPVDDVRPETPEPAMTVRAAGSTRSPLGQVAHLLGTSDVAQVPPAGARRQTSLAGNAAVLAEL